MVKIVRILISLVALIISIIITSLLINQYDLSGRLILGLLMTCCCILIIILTDIFDSNIVDEQ